MSHEKDDLQRRPILVGSVISILILILAWAVPTGMEQWLEKNWLEGEGSAVEVVRSNRALPDGPRLQVNPDRDIERLREAESQHLSSYGWVDPAEGIVRIPIDRAMQLVVAGDRARAGDVSPQGGNP